MIKETAFNTIVQVLAKLIAAAVSFLVIKHLVAGLGLDQYGIFTLLGSAYLLFDVLADFGTKTIAVREMMSSTSGDKTLNNLIALRFILSVLVFCIGSFFVILNPTLLGFRLVAWVALSMLLFTSLAGTLEFVCQVRGKMAIKSGIDIIFSLGNLLLLLGPINQKLVLVYSVYLLSRILSLLIGFGIVPIRFNFSFLEKKEIKRLWWSALPMGLYMLLFTAYDRSVDTWLINHFWSKESVAMYGVAYKIYSNLVLPAYFFMNSVFPRLSLGEETDKKMIVKKMLPWLMLGCLVVVCTTWLCSGWIMKMIIPDRALTTAAILNVLALALIFSYMNHMFGFFLVARGQPARLLVLGALGLFTNILLNFLLVPTWGAFGGAWATVGTESLMSVGLLVLYQKRA